MERVLQVLMVGVLVVIGISALLSIRAHVRVWRYAPQMERLDSRPKSPEA